MINFNVTEVRIFLKNKNKTHFFNDVRVCVSFFRFDWRRVNYEGHKKNTRTRIDKITMDEFYCQLNKIKTEKKH